MKKPKQLKSPVELDDIRPFFQATIFQGKPKSKITGVSLLKWVEESGDFRDSSIAKTYTTYLVHESLDTWALFAEHRARPTWLAKGATGITNVENDTAIIYQCGKYYFVHSNCALFQNVLDNYMEDRGLEPAGTQALLNIVNQKKLQFRTLGIHNIFNAGGTAAEGKAYFGKDARFSLTPTLDGGYGFNYCLASEQMGKDKRRPFGCSVKKNKVWQTWVDDITEFQTTCHRIAGEIGRRTKQNVFQILVQPLAKVPKALDPISFYMDFVVQDKGMVALDLGDGNPELGWISYLSGRDPYTLTFEAPAWVKKTATFRIERENDAWVFAAIDHINASLRFCDDSASPIGRRSVALVDYLNQNHNFTILFGDGIGYRDGVYWKDNRYALPFGSCDTSIAWDKTDITKESKKPGVTNSIAHTLEAAFANKCDVGICDDGSNEIADFIIIDKKSGTRRLLLVHSKYSSDPVPGLRVGDLQVVCAQALKNMRYFVPGSVEQVTDRIVTRQFVKKPHDEATLKQLIAACCNDPSTQRECWIVQPGISQGKLEKDTKNKVHILLNHVDSICKSGNVAFKLICSK